MRFLDYPNWFALRIKDENGNKIFNPGNRWSKKDNHNGIYVGQTVRTAGIEWNIKIKNAEKGTLNQRKLLFAINKYGKDAFELKILDICFSEDELNLKEIFWISETDAINNGYNYLPGPPTMAGLIVKSIPKDQLILAIQEGADKDELMEIFDASYSPTIQSRMKKYGLGDNLQEVRDFLMAPFIRIGAEDGLTRALVLKMMYENGIRILESRKHPEQAITSASRRIFKKPYGQLQKDLGSSRLYSLTISSPITRNLFTAMRELKTPQQAAEILGFNARYGNKGADRLSRFCVKISDGKAYIELQDDSFWFSVRHVLRTSRRSRLGGLGIAYELGLIDKNTDDSIKSRYKSYFVNYVPRNFNGKTIAEARRFYSTGFLGD